MKEPRLEKKNHQKTQHKTREDEEAGRTQQNKTKQNKHLGRIKKSTDVIKKKINVQIIVQK